MNARELVHVMNELTYGRGAKYAELRALGESLFHQGLIFRIDQRVVLQQKSSFQAMPAEQLGLGERSPVQLLVGYIHRAGFGIPNEIDQIDDTGRAFLGRPSAPGAREKKDRRRKSEQSNGHKKRFHKTEI